MTNGYNSDDIVRPQMNQQRFTCESRAILVKSALFCPEGVSLHSGESPQHQTLLLPTARDQHHSSRMVVAVRVAGLQAVLSLLLLLCAVQGVTQSSSRVNMRRVTHPAVRESLAGLAHLPCVFTLQPSEPRQLSSDKPSHIWWTRTWVPRGESSPSEQTIISMKGETLKVNKAFAGRVRLPGYAANNLNATMEVSGLRSNDTGTYQCQIVVGDDYERDIVPLVVMGVVFHYRSPSDRYALSFDDAQRSCQENSAIIATPTQLWASFHNGYANCAAGWLSDQTVRYPIQSPERGCYGHQENLAGVRNYGKRDPNERFDVYCFARELDGEVFHSWVPGRLTLSSASHRCISLGGQLATVGQLYLAWRAGLDTCAPGWLSDGSVRYPINQPRQGCGGDQPGIRTVIPNTDKSTTTSGSANSTDHTPLYDAYCYRGSVKKPRPISTIYTSLWKPWNYLSSTIGSDTAATDSVALVTESTSSTLAPETHTLSPSEDITPSNWTGLVDLKEGDHSTSDSWPSESSEGYVTLHLSPGESSLSWGDLKDMDPDSGAFLRPPATLSPSSSSSPSTRPSFTNQEKEPYSTPVPTEKKVMSKIVKSMWKPWNYLTGEMGATPGPVSPEKEKGDTPAPVSPEREKGATPGPVSPEREKGATPGPVSPEREKGATPGPVSPEREKGATPGPVSPEREKGATPGPVSPEREKGATPGPVSPEREKGATPGPVSPEREKGATPGPVSPEREKGATPGPVSPEREKGATPGPVSLEREKGATPGPVSPERETEGTPEASVTVSGSISTGSSDVGELETHTAATGEPSTSTGHLASATATESQSSASTAGLWSAVSDATKPEEGTWIQVAPWKVQTSLEPDDGRQGEVSTRVDVLVGAVRETGEEEGSSEGTAEEVAGPMLFTFHPTASDTPKLRIPPSEETTTSRNQTKPSPSPTQHHVSGSTSGSDIRDSSPSLIPGAGPPAPSPSAPVSSRETSPSNSWIPVKATVEQGDVGESRPLTMPSGPPVEEDTVWSYSLSSGLPSNVDEEGGGLNRSNGTLASAGAEEPCMTNPCLHGGKCLPQGQGYQGYSCYCLQGFTGENCEIDVDDCQSNPCLNGGTCIDKIDSFLCLCLPSYSGHSCEKDVEGCEHGWKKFHGHCYRYFSNRHTWENAEKDCREHSGHLSSITSATEQAFINDLGHDNAWVGLNDRTVEEDFQWTDVNDLVYENWRENQPDNFFAGGEDCVVTIAHEDGKWNDVPCNYNLPYICKKGTVLCGTPPAVENAHLIGRRRSHYDIHAVVRYQCAEGFFQRHIPTAHCRADSTWDRPKIICTKSRRSHRYRRNHHHSQRRERRNHRRHGGEAHSNY
ncbi:hypothetical protein DPEC_G00060090 [Dallia pectoralis]|uniref:Uncharacterized protein n=1 Tax=Dallia pectoralis TaxID=75939 RepID=A0ACC2H7G9_DALPE|nr:hypothetical protein DPEC_G00060090 [Dallia pectoralis]